MPQDAFTLRYLCEELNSILKGGTVNRIKQPNNDDVVFTVYTGKSTEQFFVSVNPSCPRMGLINEDKESPLTAPNFCMLLRKHLLSAKIKEISIVGFDRIVKIDFIPTVEFFDAPEESLYVELMGRYSNIILTQNNRVLGANRGINFLDNGIRPLIVGKEYVFPPTNDKLTPNDGILEKKLIEFNGENVAEFLSSNVQGIALSTSQQIVSDYYKENKSYNGKGFFKYFNEYILNKKKNPTVYTDSDKVLDVCAFPYDNIIGKAIEFESLIKAEDYYFTEKERIKRFSEKRDRLLSITTSAVKKAKKRLVAILSRKKDAGKADEYKIKGELLISNLYRLNQGEKSCILNNYYTNEDILIELDENLSIQKNAENYYKKYNKCKRALVSLTEQESSATEELNYLNSVLDEITLAEELIDLSKIQSELGSFGLMQKDNCSRKKKVIFKEWREYVIDGFTVKVGRNNVENDNLTTSARSEDIWLHAKNYHSSHVIIVAKENDVPDKVILTASEICAYYSKGRFGGKTEIVYTTKKHVKKPPKSKPGFCTYNDYNSITVLPNKHAEFNKTE